MQLSTLSTIVSSDAYNGTEHMRHMYAMYKVLTSSNNARSCCVISSSSSRKISSKSVFFDFVSRHLKTSGSKSPTFDIILKNST